tara:strand:- start:441 stop:1628 length:1188 start_codon:yes stop_codon:yes gene_type:complete
MDRSSNLVRQAQFDSALSALNGSALHHPDLDSVSEALTTTYRELTGQVARLTTELEAARLARRAEAVERERLLARLATLLDTLPGGVVIIDRNGLVSETNPQAEALLGEPLTGEQWDVIAARGCFTSNGAFEIHGRRLSITSESLNGGERIVLLADITHLHHLQDELSRKRRLTALGEMAARLAHQIRTPLASTSLYVSHLESDIEPQRRQRICTSLREQLHHMDGLITSMLSFVRGAAQESEPVAIAEVIADAVEACSAEITTRNVRMTLPPIDHDLQVMGSHDDLVAGLTNLITNAIEASGCKPKIEIWVGARDENTVMMRVLDEGKGIAPEIIDRIFDPFFTTRTQGTGLGLAVLASTATQHGGSVRAANRPNGGAEFTLELPILMNDEVSL